MTCGLLGQITTPAAGNVLMPGVDWVADNGIYSRAYPGDQAYLRWLGWRAASTTVPCRWAVAPDVVADHDATLARSWPLLRRIRAAVGAVALCAQNGATPGDMPWDYIDAVFLAGIVECPRCGWWPQVEDLPQTHCPCGGVLREWKEGPSAAAVAAEALRHGVQVHMGRVNSLRRLRLAHAMGCDSADGTFVAHGPDRNLPQLLGWLREIDGQGVLWEVR